MKTGKKIIVIFLVSLLVLISALCGAILYVYFHPLAAKSLLEGYVSHATGGMLTIKELSYSVSPLSLHVKGINLDRGKTGQGLGLKIRTLSANAEREGIFWKKTLLIKNLLVEDCSSVFTATERASGEDGENEILSVFYGIFRGVFSLLVFRDIKFEEAEISEADFQGEFSGKFVSVNGIKAVLTPDTGLEIICRARMEDASNSMVFSFPDLKITSKDFSRFSIARQEMNLSSEKASISAWNTEIADLKIKARFKYENDIIAIKQVKINSVNFLIKNDPKNRLRPISFISEGEFNLPEGLLSFHQFQFDSKELLKINGRLNASMKPHLHLEIGINGSHFSPNGLIHFLPKKIRALTKQTVLAGKVGISGAMTAEAKQGSLAFQCDLETELENNRFLHESKNLRAESLLTGTINAKGNQKDLLINMSIGGTDTTISGGGLNLRSSNPMFTAVLNYPDLKIESLSIEMPESRLIYGARDIPIENIHISVSKGFLDTGRDAFQLPIISFHSSLLKNIEASLEIAPEKSLLNLKGRDINLLQTMSVLGLIPSDLKFTGGDEVELKAFMAEDKKLSFIGKMWLNKVGFENKEGNCIGDKIEARVVMEGGLNSEISGVSAIASFSADSGEFLYDRFYADLKENNFVSSSELEYNINKKALTLKAADLELKKIIKIDFKDSLFHHGREPKISLSGAIPRTPLKPVFTFFIKEPFQTETPGLENMEVSGDVSAYFVLKSNGKARDIEGRCVLNNGSLSSGEQISLKGVELDLPVFFLSKAVKESRPLKEGFISIKSITHPQFPEQSLNLKLNAGHNSFYINTPVNLVIPGGNVQMGRIEFKDIFGQEPLVSTSLKLDIENLDEILPGIWPESIQGRAKGFLVPVKVRGQNITTEGQITAQLFDGVVVISDIGASGIFTSVPLIKFNTKINHLNLAKLTTGTSFGKIQGILQGKIEGIEIAYGQPQKFDLLLETVVQKGVTQKISVKAVDNIARIGGGASPFMGLAGVFSNFLKEFPYEKIGVRASLENDVFRVNGTIHEGGKEYLVKRGGFSGVNIVNQNPDNKIRFKDMIKRVKRATSGDSKPVIR
ncbi:hypothetical protein ACFL2O_07430 [Thermodesulfobacteriota bacterium]